MREKDELNRSSFRINKEEENKKKRIKSTIRSYIFGGAMTLGVED